MILISYACVCVCVCVCVCNIQEQRILYPSYIPFKNALAYTNAKNPNTQTQNFFFNSWPFSFCSSSFSVLLLPLVADESAFDRQIVLSLIGKRLCFFLLFISCVCVSFTSSSSSSSSSSSLFFLARFFLLFPSKFSLYSNFY